MHETLPYDQWPTDPFQRSYEVENALGSAFMANLEGQLQFIKKNCATIAPGLSDTELQAVAREAALGGVYALLMVLDGVANTPIDAKHGIEWKVQARILNYGGESQSVEVPMESGGSMTLSSFRPNKTKCVETVEVLPDGDGLCYAYHAWKDTYNSDRQLGSPGNSEVE